MNLRLVSLAACVALTGLSLGCASSAPRSTEPDPRVIELEKRVTLLEEASAKLDRVATRVAEVARTLDKLNRDPGAEEATVAVATRKIERRARRGKNHDEELELKLAEIDDRLIEIDRRLSKAKVGAGPRPGAAPRPARPLGPDPAVVYSVPVAGSPYVGPRHAKVTIVKAFEFA